MAKYTVKAPMTELSAEVQTAILRISAAKQLHSDHGFQWYPYDSFGNLEFFYQLLAASVELRGARFAHVLDVGCGDGDLAFLFEQLGSNVVAIDWPQTNYNRMQGVRKLKESLNSKVELVEANLEDGLSCLGDQRFDLVLFTGVLYHLQNPFRALSDARSRSRHCFLSTRIVSRLPCGPGELASEPLAYLVNEDELNEDRTNYWLFTPSAVERLCYRCGWITLASIKTGTDDERLYSLLERRDLLTNGVVLEGLFEPEEWNEWRWAQRKFAVAFDNPGNRFGVIRLNASYLPALWEEWGPISVELRVNGTPIQKRLLRNPGIHELSWNVEDTATVLTAQFEVSRATTPGQGEQRELSLVVLSVRFSPTPGV